MARDHSFRALILAAACLAEILACASADPVVLERISQTYLPFKFSPAGDPIFCLGEAAAEQLVYDSNAQVLYVAGNKLLRVLDIEDPANPSTAITVDVPGEVTDVFWCGDYVAATIPDEPAALPGSVFIFRSFDRTAPEAALDLLARVQTGALPDAVAFTPDCAKILVANEAEPATVADGSFFNPEGSVSVIDVAAAVAAAEAGGDTLAAAKTVDFKFVNDDPESLTEAGVRWVWRGQGLGGEADPEGETFSKDLEPEQIVTSKDGTKAYINLQENNALAVLDLTSMTIESIRSFGVKDFSAEGNELDLVEDGKVELKSWALSGLLQPDVIKTFEHDGQVYIATANEGDIKEYGEDQNITEWLESREGAELAGLTTDKVDSAVAEALSDEGELAAAVFTGVDGLSGEQVDGNDTYDELFLFGGRSFSIFLLEDMSLVYDSGSDFERVIGTYFNWTYNTDDPAGWCTQAPPPMAESAFPNAEALMDPDQLEEVIIKAEEDAAAFAQSPDPEAEGLEEPSNALTSKPSDTFDVESTSKGPQPEAIEIGFLGDRRILIATVEKGGVLFVYDISDPAAPVWQSAVYPGAHGSTFAELYNSMTLADIDPEGLGFISAEDSPIDEPLLVVSGAVSGTVSIYKITTAEIEDDCPAGEPIFEDDGKKATLISTTTNC
ncbi:unnamed protein product [Ostreobium quekettii]|uniref:Choice-of-anchor I domain-containing protein n=1 Tax=Ostreobium quekettii TaxID=121088 RepID=A0A8S1IY33_9CHLO|nr:unnamed protein product [Ostreobium quekettii]|eukprot:evm.model.scf_318.9 EVM.evm.TU.scf_318.9   scf_318:52111-61983(-)